MLNQLQDVFASSQRHDVKYVIIGGIAAVLYGVPCATFDVDILSEATTDNARRLLDALLEAGLGTASLVSAGQLLANEITVFEDKVRVDVQTTTPGLRFEQAWQNRQTMAYHGQEFLVVSRADLIAVIGSIHTLCGPGRKTYLMAYVPAWIDESRLQISPPDVHTYGMVCRLSLLRDHRFDLSFPRAIMPASTILIGVSDVDRDVRT